MTSENVPYCSKCDTHMVQRMDMETARYFWDCPMECIGTKPRKEPRNKKAKPKPASEAVVMTNAAGGMAAPLLGHAPHREPELAALDARMAEIERRIAAKRSAAAPVDAPPIVESGLVPPVPAREGALFFDAARGALMVVCDDGKPREIASADRKGCPVLRQEADGSSSLCGREPEVLNGVEHKDGLCWVHAAPTEARQPAAKPRGRVAMIVCSLVCGAVTGAGAYMEAGPGHPLVVASVSAAGVTLIPLLLAIDAFVKRLRR